MVVACLADEAARHLRGGDHGLSVLPGGIRAAGCGACLAVSTYGLRIGVRGLPPGRLRRLADHLPPGARAVDAAKVDRLYSFAAPRGRGVHALYADTAPLVRQLTLDALLENFESDLQRFVAERAPRHVFVHAGVVGWRGRAIVVPGPSMSGKTSLVRELARAGATYYSDEYAVVDAAGRVHPYARPLHVRSADAPEPRRESATSLGVRVGRRALPVALVVLTTYRPGARWRPRPLTAAAGALALLEHAVGAHQAPARVMAAITAAVRNVRIVTSPRGEAADAARLILSLVERSRVSSRRE